MFLRCDGMAVWFGVWLGPEGLGLYYFCAGYNFSPLFAPLLEPGLGLKGWMSHYSSGFASSQVCAGMPALTRGFCTGASFASSLGVLGAFFQLRGRAVVQAPSKCEHLCWQWQPLP